MTPSRRLIAVSATLALALGAAAFAQTNPYAGEQSRSIKALDARDEAALRQGQGMGFAKAAELNGFPGPMHVLELAERLQLTPGQRQATAELMQAHKARARTMGAAVVQAEAHLDRLFADRRASAELVEEATQSVARLQATLRAEHLKTHLAQTALLSPEQVKRYAELRGYTGAGPTLGAEPRSGHGHRH